MEISFFTSDRLRLPFANSSRIVCRSIRQQAINNKKIKGFKVEVP
jgi:hypothetical protein